MSAVCYEPRGGSATMLDRISLPDDLLDRVLSLGSDQRWRRRTVRAPLRGRAAPGPVSSLRSASRASGQRARGAAGIAEALEFLRAALAEGLAPGELRVVTLGVTADFPEQLLRDPDGPAVFWDAASGPTTTGWGAAAVLTGRGADRFAAVRAAADRLWPRLRAVAQPGVPALPPRLFGGFSFLPTPPPEPWRGFGEATFVLPRLAYGPGMAGGRLAVVAAAEDATPEGRERLVEVVAGALRRMSADPEAEPAPLPPVHPVGATDAAEWAAAIASIRGRIAEGRAEKIVAARMREVRVSGGVDPVRVLRGLRERTAAEARFAFRFSGSTLVGATPERLVTVRGLDLRTEALAGSIDADRGDRAEELLASAKDAAEHGYVVRAIAEALGPLCERLEYPTEPRIQRLRHVLHLQTPFTGRLGRSAHVLELVERLHPTPAVGGTPTAEAVDWIASDEPGSRGWYAAPVGWFDAVGDGEFVVALRSALLTGDRARLYAGAGIVRDSDAEAELAETEVKLRTMADALGWTP